ncbi:hypothetical protein KC358_g3642 [Hortaea werneckii]|nr:hypothetical protein KC358_g3642 [Hortaea werneckii]
MDKRIERAQALVIIGEMFAKAERDPEEEGDYMAFEQLMAEATAKKERKDDDKKDEKKDEKKDKRKSHRHFGRGHEKSETETSEATASS